MNANMMPMNDPIAIRNAETKIHTTAKTRKIAENKIPCKKYLATFLHKDPSIFQNVFWCRIRNFRQGHGPLLEECMGVVHEGLVDLRGKVSHSN